MSNFALGWKNYVFSEEDDDLAAEDGVVTVGAIADLRDMRLSRKCSVSATGSEYATVSFVWTRAGGSSDPLPVQLIGLLNYLVEAPGNTGMLWHIYGYTEAGTEALFTGTPWDRPSGHMPNHAWLLMDAPLDLHSVKVEIIASFAGSGTLTVTPGALWCGPVWSPPDGLEATWSQSVIDRGRVGLSEGNQGYARRRQKIRSFEGRAVHVPFAWAFGDEDDVSVLDIQQLLYEVGTTEPVVLFPRSQNSVGTYSPHVVHRLGIYGRFTDTGRIDHVGGDLYQWTQARIDELF